MKSFRKGFSSIYQVRIHCPVCKERIYANALKCPYCKTNFKTDPYRKRLRWQNSAMKIVLFISVIAGVSVCLSHTPIIIGILTGLIVYGLGYLIVQKIQSLRNFFHT
jgi:hypothetical protein